MGFFRDAFCDADVHWANSWNFVGQTDNKGYYHGNLGYDGLYPVLALSFVPLIYASTDLLGGSGFLAVYLAGLIMGNSTFVHQRSLMNFFDGVGWLMQISMFLTLGLLVFPSEIIAVTSSGLLIAAVLILLGRHVSVFLGMAFTGFSTNVKFMVSWVGLRGAVSLFWRRLLS